MCYVHLTDIQFSNTELSLKRQSEEVFWYASDGWASLRNRFNKSSWFERGWTLQGLIAPKHIVFYDSQWNEIGPLEKFRKDVAKVTGIEESYLHHRFGSIRWPSVSVRMSWVSRRHTSREEDLSYCLLGIFDINMPLLYGEGAEKAFIRLQTEIMRSSDDESLFAWTSDEFQSGILAKRPSYFANSGDIVRWANKRGLSRPPYSITNSGLEIAMPKMLEIWMIAYDSLIVFSRSSPGTGPFIIQNLGPSHPPAKRTPENQLYAYAICDVST